MAGAELKPKFQDHIEHHRVYMHVEVTVNVGKGESGGSELLELCLELPAKLLPRPSGKLIFQTGPRRLHGKISTSIDEVGNPRGGQNGTSHDRHQVDPHGQTWKVPGNLDRMLESLAGGHEAATGEDPFLKGPKNRQIHRFGSSEIVRVEDELFGDIHRALSGRCGWDGAGRVPNPQSVRTWPFPRRLEVVQDRVNSFFRTRNYRHRLPSQTKLPRFCR